MNSNTLYTGLNILAFISAVLNYAGFVQIIPSDDWWLKSLCLLTAIGVWVCLYLFWSYAFSILPHLRMSTKRLGGWVTILAGCMVIIALSTYWNVIAYTGKEVLRLSMTENVIRAEQQFAKAVSVTGGYESLPAQLEALSQKTFQLAEGEERSGAVTGSRGRGGISALLRQIGDNVNAIAGSLKKTAQRGQSLKNKGKACLALMRKASALGSSGEPSAKLAAGADCLNGVMADLGNQNAASGIVQAMQGLTSGVVVPVSIRSKRQRQALTNILEGLQNQADQIAKTARAIPEVIVQPVTLDRPNMVTAVLKHWQSIIPAIATALAIDLLPLLLLILAVLLNRDGEAARRPRYLWTADQLSDAQMQLHSLHKSPPAKLIASTLPEDDKKGGSDQ